MTIGEFIKVAAKNKGYSIRKLSAELDMPYSSLLYVINKKSDRIDINLLRKIATILDVQVEELLGLNKDKLLHVELKGIETDPENQDFNNWYEFQKRELAKKAEEQNNQKIAYDAKTEKLIQYYEQLNQVGKDIALSILKGLTENPALTNPLVNSFTLNKNDNDN